MNHLDPQSLDTFAEQWIATDRLHAQLAEEYCDKCNRYDEQVCTGRYKDVLMPVTPDEARLVSSHSRMIWQDILQRGLCTERELQNALAHRGTAVQP